MKTVIIVTTAATGLLIWLLCSGCAHQGTGAFRYDFTNAVTELEK